jgi:hypothetical protein
MNALEKFVGQALVPARFKNPMALSKAVGMSMSAFSRGLRAGTLNIENLLRLADLAEAHPSEVLRLAGKGDAADLIERLYGVNDKPLTSQDREVLALPAPVKRELLRLAAALNTPPSAERKETRIAGDKRRST